ncbi:MAG: four helix bundle suffix domain-containing protein [Verrucomicrobiota bacterium]|nr:four helix bundle suffix domain-containing protein [Verrucomicrobiota bacterium]
MVQAARSGKQNIIEGSKAAITSTETELKLTNVARASLDELLEDYHDYLRVSKLVLWDKNCDEASYVRKLSSGKIAVPKSIIKDNNNSHSLSEVHRAFIFFIENKPANVCANIMICLINQCNFLLDRQIKHQEENFVKNGGLRETMFKARLNYRNSKK